MSKNKSKRIGVRSAPNGYFAAFFILSFVAAFLLHYEYNGAAVGAFAAAWMVVPVLALTDKIVFDGVRLRRTGLLPRLWMKVGGGRDRLRLAHIEQVETHAIRSLKRGGRVHYRYRTAFRGRGTVMVAVSGGAGFRRLVTEVLRRLPDEVMDTRSMELRDFAAEPADVAKRADESKIPHSEVLEASMKELRHRSRRRAPAANAVVEHEERAEHLRQLANELRISGSLTRALEAFRRAAILSPNNGWLLFEFARCLQSVAGAERDGKLERRALAMMRLAERRAGDDGELLARLGENYFQAGDWSRADIVYNRCVDRIGETFLAMRGLAEIALRQGKIAHVIHNFSAANRSTSTGSLKRWTQGEVEYFSKLNSDEEYMELEVSRVNLADSLTRSRRTAVRIGLFGMPLILAGILLEEDLVANIGWAISMVSVAFWIAISLLRQTVERRIPVELVDSE